MKEILQPWFFMDGTLCLIIWPGISCPNRGIYPRVYLCLLLQYWGGPLESVAEGRGQSFHHVFGWGNRERWLCDPASWGKLSPVSLLRVMSNNILGCWSMVPRMHTVNRGLLTVDMGRQGTTHNQQGVSLVLSQARSLCETLNILHRGLSLLMKHCFGMVLVVVCQSWALLHCVWIRGFTGHVVLIRNVHDISIKGSSSVFGPGAISDTAVFRCTFRGHDWHLMKLWWHAIYTQIQTQTCPDTPDTPRYSLAWHMLELVWQFVFVFLLDGEVSLCEI